MGHIIAIGGGEIGRPGYSVETTGIDKQIIAATSKTRPTVLFLPTASKDSPGYYEVFKKQYNERLGCRTEVLNLYAKPSIQDMELAVAMADVIYVGGGNTLAMMMLWRRIGFDKLLINAYHQQKILCGLSAGAICWFESGLSDSRSFTSNGRTWNYINVHGLGIKDVRLCPHYDAEIKRQPALKNSLKGTTSIAIALDDCAALEIRDNEYRILYSRDGAKAHKAYWKDNEYHVEDINPNTHYSPISMITN